MRVKLKNDYNDKITLWAIVPPIVLCAFSSFVFWMLPLGLGFNSKAVEKLNSGLTCDIFQIIFWAGPVSIIVAILLTIGGLIKPALKFAIRRIILILIGVILFSQISMLIYLSM